MKMFFLLKNKKKLFFIFFFLPPYQKSIHPSYTSDPSPFPVSPLPAPFATATSFNAVCNDDNVFCILSIIFGISISPFPNELIIFDTTGDDINDVSSFNNVVNEHVKANTRS